MTEAEWLISADPEAMFPSLRIHFGQIGLMRREPNEREHFSGQRVAGWCGH
jgi:hypothetical protein